MFDIKENRLYKTYAEEISAVAEAQNITLTEDELHNLTESLLNDDYLNQTINEIVSEMLEEYQ